MSKCLYCGHDAGWLTSDHPHCKERYDQGWHTMVDAAARGAADGADTKDLQDELTRLARSTFHPVEHVRGALIQGWERAVDKFLEDGVLSKEEEQRLATFAENLNLSASDVNENGAYTRVQMSCTLREILSGTVPAWEGDSPLPFNLTKSETLVWVSPDTPYYEERLRRSYVGGYQSVNVRIMKGVYYRIGGFRGNPVETAQMEHLDTGTKGITSKNVYFAGTRRSFRVPYQKIVSFTPYQDGLAITRDAANARPQIFKTGQGWFTYNLVANLARLN